LPTDLTRIPIDIVATEANATLVGFPKHIAVSDYYVVTPDKHSAVGSDPFAFALDVQELGESSARLRFTELE
jgi:hypothetical protein